MPSRMAADRPRILVGVSQGTLTPLRGLGLPNYLRPQATQKATRTPPTPNDERSLAGPLTIGGASAWGSLRFVRVPAHIGADLVEQNTVLDKY